MAELAYILGLTQAELKVVLYNYLREKNMSPMFEDGFVYAEGDIPVLLVAHMDTVFDEPPKNLYYDKKNDELFSYEGGIGAEKTVEKLPKPNVKYIIEFDRKGNNDCVFYDCGNDEFIDYVESFGFITNYGTFSDISVLVPAWDIGAVNLSSGYYNAHTENEYIKFKELKYNINRVKSMLRKSKRAKYFDYQEIKYIPQADSVFYDDLYGVNFMKWLNNFYETSPQSETQNGEKTLVLRMENIREVQKVINNGNE